MRVLHEGYPTSTNKTGFRWFSKYFCIFVHWTKVASALEGLRCLTTQREREIPATPSVAQYSHMIKTAGLHNAHSNWFSLSTPQPELAPRFVREITFSWLNGLWWSLSLVNRHFFFIECSNSEVGNKTFIKALRVKSILTLNELYKVVLL